MTWFNPASTIVHGHVQHKLCKTPAPFVQAGKHSAISSLLFQESMAHHSWRKRYRLVEYECWPKCQSPSMALKLLFIYTLCLLHGFAQWFSSPLDQAITVACMYSQIVQCKESACALKTLKPWYHMNSIPWVCKPGVNTGNSIPCFESVFHSRISTQAEGTLHHLARKEFNT